MSIQPQTQIDKLLSELSNLPKGRVLSEFALARFLNQADKLIPFDAGHAWHVKGVANYYANETTEMIRCFNIAINLLPSDSTLLNNYAACLINQGLLEELLNLLLLNISFYILDKDLIAKVARLTLDKFNKVFFNQLISILDTFENIPHITQIKKDFLSDMVKAQQILQRLNLTWEDANQISNLAFQLMRKAKVRSNSFVQTKTLDEEFINIISLYTDIDTIFKLNDELFDEVFSRGLIDIWNKFMCMFAIAPIEQITPIEV